MSCNSFCNHGHNSKCCSFQRTQKLKLITLQEVLTQAYRSRCYAHFVVSYYACKKPQCWRCIRWLSFSRWLSLLRATKKKELLLFYIFLHLYKITWFWKEGEATSWVLKFLYKQPPTGILSKVFMSRTWHFKNNIFFWSLGKFRLPWY